MLKRIPRRNHITPVLREFHWLRIHDRIILKILLLTHKAVNNTAPEYLCDLIRLSIKSTTIRTCASFDPCLLCVPTISKTLHSIITFMQICLQLFWKSTMDHIVIDITCTCFCMCYFVNL